jgi:hypothetical protein
MPTGIIPATGLQNSVWTATGGSDAIPAPCLSEKFDLVSGAHTFTVTRVDLNGNALGGAASAEAISSTCDKFTLESGRGFPFAQGATLCILVGTSSDVISVIPRQTGS